MIDPRTSPRERSDGPASWRASFSVIAVRAGDPGRVGTDTAADRGRTIVDEARVRPAEDQVADAGAADPHVRDGRTGAR